MNKITTALLTFGLVASQATWSDDQSFTERFVSDANFRKDILFNASILAGSYCALNYPMVTTAAGIVGSYFTERYLEKNPLTADARVLPHVHLVSQPVDIVTRKTAAVLSTVGSHAIKIATPVALAAANVGAQALTGTANYAYHYASQAGDYLKQQAMNGLNRSLTVAQSTLARATNSVLHTVDNGLNTMQQAQNSINQHVREGIAHGVRSVTNHLRQTQEPIYHPQPAVAQVTSQAAQPVVDQAAPQVATQTESCVICLEPMQDPYTLPCGHKMCKECAKNMYGTHVDTAIPFETTQWGQTVTVAVTGRCEHCEPRCPSCRTQLQSSRLRNELGISNTDLNSLLSALRLR